MARGETVALIFDIESDGSGSVALGAGLFSSSGTEYSAGIGDIDNNGIVNGADLATLLGAWGVCAF